MYFFFKVWYACWKGFLIHPGFFGITVWHFEKEIYNPIFKVLLIWLFHLYFYRKLYISLRFSKTLQRTLNVYFYYYTFSHFCFDSIILIFNFVYLCFSPFLMLNNLETYLLQLFLKKLFLNLLYVFCCIISFVVVSIFLLLLIFFNRQSNTRICKGKIKLSLTSVPQPHICSYSEAKSTSCEFIQRYSKLYTCIYSNIYIFSSLLFHKWDCTLHCIFKLSFWT